LNIDEFKKDPDKYKNVGYTVKIIRWNENDDRPIGKIIDVNAYFDEYYSEKDVKKGIKNKTLFKGKVKILESKNCPCSVILEDTKEEIIIEGKKHRNRAMDGDEVVVEIIDDSSDIKKGKIVYLNFDKCAYKTMKIEGRVKCNEEKNFIDFFPVSNHKNLYIKIF